MIEKISLNIKISAKNDTDQILEVLQKSKTSKVKNDTDYTSFNLSIINEEKLASEKLLHNLKTKKKHAEEVINPQNLIAYPVHVKVEESFLKKIGKNKKVKCSKCGNLTTENTCYKTSSSSEVFICAECMSNDIKQFLEAYIF